MEGRRVSPAGSPPSDSDAFATSGDTSTTDNHKQQQERYLPIANVSRIMKRSLPANAKISKEAKESVQECVSEFISFVTGEASDKCRREKRKTVNGDDLLWAMTSLGFDNYVSPLKAYLNTYRPDQSSSELLQAVNVDVKDYSPQPPAPSPQGDHYYSAAYNSTLSGSVPDVSGGFLGGGMVFDVRMGSNMSGGGVQYGLQW